MDKVPDDQKVIHVSHLFNRRKFIIQPVCQLLCHRLIPFLQAFKAQFVQVFPGRVTFRHIVFRQLCHAEFDLHIAPLGNLLSIFQCLQGIGKKLRHLFRGFYVVLTAFVTHAILIVYLLSGLDTQQNVMGFGIIRKGIVHIVGAYQLNPCLMAHAKQCLIDHLLLRNAVILQFKEEITLPKDRLIGQSRLFCFFILPPGDTSGHFSGQAGTQGNDTLMVFFQYGFIHTGLVIIAFHKALRYDLHQIAVACIILCQKHQMIIPVLSAGCFLIVHGSRRHIDFTAQDRTDPGSFCRTVKIDHTVHDAVIGDGRTVHAKLFNPVYVFCYLVGTVQ